MCYCQYESPWTSCLSAFEWGSNTFDLLCPGWTWPSRTQGGARFQRPCGEFLIFCHLISNLLIKSGTAQGDRGEPGLSGQPGPPGPRVGRQSHPFITVRSIILKWQNKERRVLQENEMVSPAGSLWGERPPRSPRRRWAPGECWAAAPSCFRHQSHQGESLH